MSGGQIMVVLIVMIACLTGILKAKYQSERRRGGELDVARETAAEEADSGRLREEVRTLKERIAVLERIATDRTTSLDHEIERLRDR